MGKYIDKDEPKFLVKKKGDGLLWEPIPAVSETELELLMESQIQRPYKYHLMMVPCLINFLWRKNMGKEVDLLTVLVGIPFWGLVEHKPLIIALFLPIFYRRNLRVTLKIKWIY